MKKVAFIAVILVSPVVLLLLSQEFTYVGASKCQICHKTESQGLQYPIWQKSKHSASFGALNSPDAAFIAQGAGLQNPPENPACLKCHAPLFEKAPELKAEGVTCEVCHGPGSEYKKLSIMKDRVAATKNGLVVYESQDATRRQCLTCHENAHGISFDFVAGYQKIKHPKPEAK
ncbi:MAG: multiheme c-type cytochrome [Clostridiales bacterium]|nr:multiheme c-type cytochrome [Clostridiales bacterium]